MLKAMIVTALFLSAANTSAQAGGDAGAGEKVFLKCKACHQLGEDAKNGAGPELNGIIGRVAAEVSGFKYSDAMRTSGITWDEASLRAFLSSPKTKMPGTKMPFAGLKNPADIDNLLSYLKIYDRNGRKL